jgi:membrane dipeptidase
VATTLIHNGLHEEGTVPYVFVDSCVQIWPDADFSRLNRYTPTAYAVTAWRPHDDAGAALDAMADWHRIARWYPESVRIAWTANDIVEAKQQNQAALILASQGSDFVGNHLDRLEMFHRMGLRLLAPAYNFRNSLCDGLLEATVAGLSKLGREWVAECNRLGILIDLTHVAEDATLEIMDLTSHPVTFSHSNPKALVDNPRNITDEQMRRCAATGGVVSPTNWGPLNFSATMTKRPTVDDFIRALDYVVDLVGIDHAGIGTDMSHGLYPDGDLIRGRSPAVGGSYGAVVDANPRSTLRFCEGFENWGQLPNAIERLQGMGYSEENIVKILGGNYLRIFRQVWGA